MTLRKRQLEGYHRPDAAGRPVVGVRGVKGRPRGMPDRTSRLARLSSGAYEQALRMGHRLGPWVRDDFHEMAASCRDCDRFVTVYSKPEDDDRHVQGKAVTEGCVERIVMR
jgi:hypothetical protein